ncbi:hypothetical protein C5C41_16240 [Rathayibacter sp. AY1E9]|uniref:hypothetical protein n=1 Tax=unclassified Rathayibacter TaxID=2609250 RepID=UPI000CE8F263|nr:MULTISPECIES: hypothetical protein [unclassified Rathayibacter]PPG48989.1 hypothetical protein C5C41_16240 [Rathayibacter sp. AY1E9]PPH36819.1 hypothetical protein C5C86_15705 [Rathayibacter sp. AY1E4]
MRSETELREALTQAQDLLTEAEIDYRQLRFLTDDELRAFMVEQVSAEKASIRRAVEADCIYVVAGADVRRVHFWDCSSLREQIDRDRAWSFWLHGDPENFRKEVAHGDGGPRMPILLDRAAVETLSTYVTCQICSPTLSHTRKARGERTTKLTSLVARHIGRSLTALDGSPLGQLQRIVTTVDAHGSTVLVETTTQSFTDEERPAILVAPVGS